MIKVANNLNVLFEKRSAISDYLNNDYVRYGAGGALAGAGLGALINKLMGGSALKGGLLGAGLGAGAGLGYKGLSDYQAKQRSDAGDKSMTSVEDTRARGAEERARRAEAEQVMQTAFDQLPISRLKKDPIEYLAELRKAKLEADRIAAERAPIARGQSVGGFVPSLPTPQDQQFAFNSMADVLEADRMAKEREQKLQDAINPLNIEQGLIDVLRQERQQSPNLRIAP